VMRERDPDITRQCRNRYAFSTLHASAHDSKFRNGAI
jgi:hypothetical protein